MSTEVQVSKDQTDWEEYRRGTTRIEEFRWIRTLEYVERSWSGASINVWLGQKRLQPNTHIEYSTDDGYSYVIFRLGPSGTKEDGARIFTIVNNNKYKVRAVTLTENQNVLTNVIQSYNGGAPQEKVPAIRTDHRWVVRHNKKFDILKKKPLDYICEIEHRIPMSLSMQNENHVTIHDPSAIVPAELGHVYYLQHCATLPFKWQVVMSSHMKRTIDAMDWTWVESARVYDNETVTFSEGIFACAVLSDKYYVATNGQSGKIGSHFLIQRKDADLFIKTINSHDGYAAFGTLQTSYVKEKQEDLLERIKVVKDELRSAVASRDVEKILNTLFDSMEFRDKAVDELKDLNTVIAEARALAMELTNAGAAGNN
jgi:hypothetical protein